MGEETEDKIEFKHFPQTNVQNKPSIDIPKWSAELSGLPQWQIDLGAVAVDGLSRIYVEALGTDGVLRQLQIIGQECNYRTVYTPFKVINLNLDGRSNNDMLPPPHNFYLRIKPPRQSDKDKTPPARARMRYDQTICLLINSSPSSLLFCLMSIHLSMQQTVVSQNLGSVLFIHSPGFKFWVKRQPKEN